MEPNGFDYIITSHTIEHFPDLIGFFQQAEAVLKHDGVLSFAFPDMRASFDYYRTPTTTPGVVEAFKQKRRIHSAETIFHAHLYAVQGDGAGSWVRGQVDEIILCEPQDHALRKYEAYLERISKSEQSYVDAHAWTATPSSFKLLMMELNSLCFTSFFIEELKETIGAEFLVKMSKKRGAFDLDTLNVKRIELLRDARRELAEVDSCLSSKNTDG